MSNHSVHMKLTTAPRRKTDRPVAAQFGAVRLGLAEDLVIATRRATFVPASWDETAQTVEALVSSGAAVQRRDSRGVYVERLDLSAVDVTKLYGLPVLDGHRAGSSRDVVGVITSARRDGSNIVATIRLSQAADVASVRTKVAEGALSSVSIGYGAAARVETVENGQRTITITPQIREVSLVAIGADPLARIRSKTMENEDDVMDPPAAEPTVTEIRATIRQIGRAAGLPTTWADAQIDAEATPTEARAAAFEAMQTRTRSTPIIRTVAAQNDDPAVIVRRTSDALAYRMGATEMPDDARPSLGLSMLDMARDSLVRSGVSTRGLTPDEVFTRAGQHTTSDFPLVVSNAMNKVALERYKAAESPLKALARKRTLPNFKDSTAIRLSGMGRLEEMTESGEFTHTTRAEEGESLHLRTFGRAINLSRKLIINDDAGLLGDMVAAFGDAAAQTEAEELVATLTGSAPMSDGKPAFHASRGNVGAPVAFGADTSAILEALSDARLAMRQRKDLDGKTIIGVTPKYLLVSPENETEAERVLATIQPGDTDSVNVFAGKLQLIVEPRLTGPAWYLFADPARMPALAFAYLGSAQGVQVQRTEAWDTLGTKYRAFLDFGCGWTDARGAYRNAGK